MLPRIIAHGGAWDWDDDIDAGKIEGLKAALSIGYDLLKKGGPALDAVEQTVIALEDNPVFDAGTGGYLNQEGQVQLDALIVDGAAQDFGAVAGVTQIQNPVTLARKIMAETPQCFFVGPGADQLAERMGLPLISNDQLVTSAMQAFYQAQRTDGPSDTVGAVAIDSSGNLAAATSTSGTPFKPVGRVGDSPLYGSGAYAENEIGAAGATGHGEQIMRLLLSKYSCDKLVEGHSALEAARATMHYVETVFADSMTGVILLDAQGNVGAAHTTPKLACGWVDDQGEIQATTRPEFG